MASVRLMNDLSIELEVRGNTRKISEIEAQQLCFQLGVVLLELDYNWMILGDLDFQNHHYEDEGWQK